MLSREQIAALRKADASGQYRSVTAKQFKISLTTVIKYCGIKQFNKPKVTAMQVDRILRDLWSGKTIKVTALDNDVDYKTVYRIVLKNHELFNLPSIKRRPRNEKSSNH